MEKIDLRSDTVTKPTSAMREAMCRAEVGDDVFREDPSVNLLEMIAAKKTRKEAGLFVSSGTMANLVAILAHCTRGDEVILGDLSHTYIAEQGGYSVLGGVFSRPIPNQPDGTLRLDHIRKVIQIETLETSPTRLIALENTQNVCGGVAIPPDYFALVRELAHEHGIKIHLDGARLFNSAIALDIEASEITQYVDSVMFCLSKGLCAPVGSLLCGDEEFIYRARRARKILGGGMRQAGILAAAGIIAMEQMVDRLAEDHLRAKRLAQGISNIPGYEINLDVVQTNIVFFRLNNDIKKRIDEKEVIKRLCKKDVLLLAILDRGFRAVTHYWISDQAIDKTLIALEEVIRDIS